VAFPKSQQSLSLSAWVSAWSHSTAITLLDGVLKKRIILIFLIFRSLAQRYIKSLVQRKKRNKK